MRTLFQTSAAHFLRARNNISAIVSKVESNWSSVVTWKLKYCWYIVSHLIVFSIQRSDPLILDTGFRTHLIVLPLQLLSVISSPDHTKTCTTRRMYWLVQDLDFCFIFQNSYSVARLMVPVITFLCRNCKAYQVQKIKFKIKL